MARIDVVLDDDIEKELRMQVVKRFGGRKGGLSKALEQAIELWIKNDIIEDLKKNIINEDTIPSQQEDMINTLRFQGKSAIPALVDLLQYDLLPSTKELLNRHIRELSIIQ